MSRKNFLKVAGVLLVIFAVILPTYFATIKLISETLFGLIFVAFLIGGFLLYKLDEIVEFETTFVKLRTLKKEIYAKVEEVRQLSKELHEDKEELRKSIRVSIETLYLTLSSRHRFPIPEKISNEITKNLNVLANLAIKNQTEEGEWKKRMDEINKLLEEEVK